MPHGYYVGLLGVLCETVIWLFYYVPKPWLFWRKAVIFFYLWHPTLRCHWASLDDISYTDPSLLVCTVNLYTPPLPQELVTYTPVLPPPGCQSMCCILSWRSAWPPKGLLGLLHQLLSWHKSESPKGAGWAKKRGKDLGMYWCYWDPLILKTPHAHPTPHFDPPSNGPQTALAITLPAPAGLKYAAVIYMGYLAVCAHCPATLNRTYCLLRYCTGTNGSRLQDLPT